MSKLSNLKILTVLRSVNLSAITLRRISSACTRICLCQTNTSLIKRRFTERQIYIAEKRHYASSSDNETNTELTANQYEDVSEETLQSLSDKFDMLAETIDCDPEYDVSYGSGVLTVKISDSWGTYVINKQTPNKQIWLSSPISGPKRYDYINGRWIYSHDGGSLHQLLTEEISKALCSDIDFSDCEYTNR